MIERLAALLAARASGPESFQDSVLAAGRDCLNADVAVIVLFGATVQVVRVDSGRQYSDDAIRSWIKTTPCLESIACNEKQAPIITAIDAEGGSEAGSAFGACLAIPFQIDTKTHGGLIFLAEESRVSDWSSEELAAGRIMAEYVRSSLAAEQAAQNTAWLDTLMEYTPSLVWLKDTNNNLIRVSKGVAKLAGKTPDEMVGRSCVDFYDHAEDYYRDDLAVIRSGTPKLGYVEPVAREGVTRQIRTDKLPVRGSNGDVDGIAVIATDVTNQAELINDLLKAQERVEHAVEGSHDGLWDWFDIKGDEKWWSPQFYRLLGYEPGEIQPSLSAFKSLLHPDDLNNTFKKVQAALAGEAPFDTQYRLRLKSGEYRWFRARARVYTDDNGEPKRMAGAIQDIHELIEALQLVEKREEELRESAQRYRLMEELATDGMWDWNLITDEEYLSPRWKAEFGYEDHELPNHASTWQQMILPEDLKLAFKAYQEHTQEGKPFAVEVRYRHKDGSTVWILCRGHALRDASGRFIRMIGSHTNITPLKDAQRALADNERRLREITENIDEVFWLIRGNGERDYVSPAYETIWQRSRETLYAQPSDWINAVHHEDRQRVLDAFQQAFHGTTATTEYDVEYRIVRPDGDVRWIHDRGMPVKAGDQAVGRYAGLAIDITARKANEQQLADYARELEEQNRDLDEFTYVASHDLQEPLRQLISFSSLLESDIGRELPEAAERDLHFITEAARRMQTLVQDLLQLSRAGRNEIRLERCSLQKCVAASLDALAIRIEETQAMVTVEELPTIHGDCTLLTQLYQNLIGNAIKFAKPDTSPEIRISAQRDGNHWVVTVSDNGIGIQPQYLEGIFAPFKRLHAKADYPGSGIGLAICRKVIERHDGRIWVDSVIDKGSQFRFTLPSRYEVQHAEDKQ